MKTQYKLIRKKQNIKDKHILIDISNVKDLIEKSINQTKFYSIVKVIIKLLQKIK
jgi:hypothetical protein